MLELDDSLYPVLVTRWAGETTLEELERFIAWYDGQLKKAIERKDLIFSISDAGSLLKSAPPVRKRVAEWMNLKTEAEVAVVLYSIMIIQNPIIRGVLTAVTWMSNRKETKIMRSVEDALALAETALPERGIPLPQGFALRRKAR